VPFSLHITLGQDYLPRRAILRSPLHAGWASSLLGECPQLGEKSAQATDVDLARRAPRDIVLGLQ
jgi:hypothetical protein